MRILCLGESTTASTAFRDHSWPRQLQRLLDDKAPGRFAVINAGRSSTNTAVLVARTPGLMDTYHPQVVVAMMGVNDSRWYGVVRPKSPGLTGTLKATRLWRLGLYARHELFHARTRPSPTPATDVALTCRAAAAGDAPQAVVERDCAAAVAADPDDWTSVRLLVDAERGSGRVKEAEAALRAYLKRAPDSEWAQVWLAEVLLKEERYAEAEPLLRHALETFHDPVLVNRALPDLEGVYQATGRPDLARKAYEQVIELETPGEAAVGAAPLPPKDDADLSPVTAQNHRALRDLVRARGARLVVMQYPTLPVSAARRYFDEAEGVLFVENKANFAAARRRDPATRLFKDRFRQTWGHCTAAGDSLIAKALLAALQGEKLLDVR